jgi:hypothetical protein
MKGRSAGAIAILGAATILASAAIQPATAAPAKWLAVQLGAHRFGHLRAPDAIVARAAAKNVGFECGRPSACGESEHSTGAGCGCIDVLPQGPTSFDVARDGSIWVLDGVNNRLLVWRAGSPARTARAVRLPRNLGLGDFALGPRGLIYLSATPRGSGHRKLWALTRTGRVRWQASLAVADRNDVPLRMGPDGVLYAAGRRVDGRPAWTPLTTPAGRPLPLAQQRHRTTGFQPLGGGLRLVASERSSHEVRFTVSNRAGRTVHAWRVTSRTGVAYAWRALTPALVDGDLVVPFDVSRQDKTTFRWEHMIVRLGVDGGARRRFALDAQAAWDPDGSTVLTPLRVGLDGRLYQLRSDPSTGVSVARYSLGSN